MNMFLLQEKNSAKAFRVFWLNQSKRCVLHPDRIHADIYVLIEMSFMKYELTFLIPVLTS